MNLLILAALALSSRDAAASIPDLVGEGPANIGMGSAGTALANDAYAPYYNPAGLTQLRRITLGLAPVHGQKCLAGFSGIVQDTNGDVMPVEYRGVIPGNFDQAVSIVAIGAFKGDHFEANQLLVKCPSKYQAMESETGGKHPDCVPQGGPAGPAAPATTGVAS